MKRLKAFTLIELLIVVAIIAILAAIAVPNFLEAQTRAKVTRGHADMRSLATALESYRIDHAKYPPDYQFYQGFGDGQARLDNPFANATLARLTTPVAFMTTIPENVFEYKPDAAYDSNPRWYGYKSEDSWRTFVLPAIEAQYPEARLNHLWVLVSVGPDNLSNAGEYAMFGEEVLNSIESFEGIGGALYDPSNGTISSGDLVRLGP